MDSLAEASIKDGVEFEKCVVAQHRTTLEQRNTFASHLASCSRNKIPIEWVIGELFCEILFSWGICFGCKNSPITFSLLR